MSIVWIKIANIFTIDFCYVIFIDNEIGLIVPRQRGPHSRARTSHRPYYGRSGQRRQCIVATPPRARTSHRPYYATNRQVAAVYSRGERGGDAEGGLLWSIHCKYGEERWWARTGYLSPRQGCHKGPIPRPHPHLPLLYTG